MGPKELKESLGSGHPTKNSLLLKFGSPGFETWGFLVDHKILN